MKRRLSHSGSRTELQPRRLCHSRTTAFSLIELLVTVALILILATMMYGFGSRSHQETEKKACAKNLEKIYVALQIYANEHHGAFPALSNAATAEAPLAQLVPQYTADTSLFICPGSKDSALPEGESFAGRRISYAYFMGRGLTDGAAALMSDRQIDTRPKSAGQAAFSTTGRAPGNNHSKYGGNFLFGDGHLQTTPATIPFSLTWPQDVVLLNPKP